MTTRAKEIRELGNTNYLDVDSSGNLIIGSGRYIEVDAIQARQGLFITLDNTVSGTHALEVARSDGTVTFSVDESGDVSSRSLTVGAGLFGNLTGNVNGNVTGDISGNVTASTLSVSQSAITFPAGTYRSIFIPIGTALNPDGGNYMYANDFGFGVLGDGPGGVDENGNPAPTIDGKTPIGYYPGIEIDSTNAIYFSWIMPSDYKTNGNIRITTYTVGQFVGTQTVTTRLYNGSDSNAGKFQGSDGSGTVADYVEQTYNTTNSNPDHQAWRNEIVYNIPSGIGGANLDPRDLVMWQWSSNGIDTNAGDYDILLSGILVDYETAF